MTFDLPLIIPAIVSLLAMTSPFDPVKVLLFNSVITDPPRSRVPAAVRVALYVLLVLGATALAGRQALNLLNIDINAFRVVGGLIIGAIGAEMLFGGGASSTNGERQRQRGPEEGDALMVPLTMPLLAGPGAIAATMSIASQGDQGEGVVAALIAAGVVAAVAFACFSFFGEAFEKMKPTTMSSITRIGGLLTATIGAQMFLEAIKDFFAA